jgi:hypothetical protein
MLMTVQCQVASVSQEISHQSIHTTRKGRYILFPREHVIVPFRRRPCISFPWEDRAPFLSRNCRLHFHAGNPRLDHKNQEHWSDPSNYTRTNSSNKATAQFCGKHQKGTIRREVRTEAEGTIIERPAKTPTDTERVRVRATEEGKDLKERRTPKSRSQPSLSRVINTSSFKRPSKDLEVMIIQTCTTRSRTVRGLPLPIGDAC